MAVIDSVHASRTSFTVDTLLSVKTVPTTYQSTKTKTTRRLSLVIAGKKRLNRVLEGSLLAWNAHDLLVHSLHHANLASDKENARFTRSSAICFNSGTDTLKRARMNLLYILYSRNDSEFTGNVFPVAGVSIESDSKKSHKRLKKPPNYDNSLYPLFQTLIFCLCYCFLRLYIPTDNEGEWSNDRNRDFFCQPKVVTFPYFQK